MYVYVYTYPTPNFLLLPYKTPTTTAITPPLNSTHQILFTTMDHHHHQEHEICWPRSLSNRNYDRLASYSIPQARSRQPIWVIVWKKIKKEKQRMFHQPTSSNSSMRFTYDPHSYSQNFDEGFMWADADHLSRSFSARFAAHSSRIFDKNTLVV